MATRSDPIGCLLVWSAPGGSGVGTVGTVVRAVVTACAGPALGADELVEPPDLALDGVEPVGVELERVGVEPLAGPLHRAADPLEPLLEPRAPTLEDPQPDGGVGAREEREVHAERLVLPGGRPRLAEQVAEALLALC